MNACLHPFPAASRRPPAPSALPRRSERANRRIAEFAVAAFAALASGIAFAEPPAAGERGTPRDEPRPTQRVNRGSPPSIPADTPTDPGAPLPPRAGEIAPVWRIRRESSSALPATFNPDPGAGLMPASESKPPYFTSDWGQAPAPFSETPPRGAPQTRESLESARLEMVSVGPALSPAQESLPESQRLPRHGTRENRFIPSAWRAPTSDRTASSALTGETRPALTPDRWRTTGFVPWRRYTSGESEESPYAHPQPARWHPYRQSLLKGDLPIHGEDVFVSLTASADVWHEDRTLPLPGGVGAAAPGSRDFSGESRAQAAVANLAFQVEAFRGATVFKPVDWRVRLRPVLNFNRTHFHPTGLPASDPRGAAATRSTVHLALQEAFFEKHLADLSSNYDFVAVRAGNQSFNSDFRGFIFNDTNLGVRLFGNHDNNRSQYNLAAFDLREKDPNSDLNTLSRRGQVVVVANYYRQDFWQKGYTAALSLHASFDQPDLHYDTNGGLVRPAPLGAARPHRVDSYYLGWAGDGHLGRWNLSHAAYLALGRDRFNGLAGRSVDILAQFAALELSYDRDWIRFKVSVLAASGDRDPTDGRATGFDSILDNPNFTGGPFSYYVRQGIDLGGSVGLKPRFSLLPNLRTSKTQGQQNFVNPGLTLGGIGADLQVTPKLRAFFNANRLGFASTQSLRSAVVTNRVASAFGTDLSLGVQWRPWLTDNWMVSLGCGVLLPGQGYRDLYRRNPPVVAGVANPAAGARIDRFLHSTVIATTVTY